MTTDKCTSKYGRENCRTHGTKIPSPVPPFAESQAKLADLNARVFTTHSRTEFLRLETERKAVQLDMDASPEGLVELGKRVLANKHDDPFRYTDEQRWAEARAHQADRLTETAVSDYLSAGNRNYRRLFFDTGLESEPYERDGHVYIPEDTRSDAGLHSIPVNDTYFDERLTRLRREVGKRQADHGRYGKSGLERDLNRSQYLPLPQPLPSRAAHVVNGGDPDAVIARVDFNENGAFERAIVAHSAGDGAVVTIDSPAHFRAFLARAKKAQPPYLPSYITGREERRPAHAAPAQNDIEELDVLF